MEAEVGIGKTHAYIIAAVVYGLLVKQEVLLLFPPLPLHCKINYRGVYTTR